MDAISMDQCSRLGRKGVAAVFAAGLVGCGATWLTIADIAVFRRYEVSIINVHPMSLLVTLGPGVFGLLMLTASLLILARRRFGVVLYWFALLVGVGALLLLRQTYVGVKRFPGDYPWLWFTNEGTEDASFWTFMEVAAFGVLVLVGRWIPDFEPPAVGTCDDTGVVSSAASGPPSQAGL